MIYVSAQSHAAQGLPRQPIPFILRYAPDGQWQRHILQCRVLGQLHALVGVADAGHEVRAGDVLHRVGHGAALPGGGQVDVVTQPVITKDNVTMQIDTVIYFQITDPKLYTYGVESIPMLLVFRNGQLVNKSIGFVSQPEIEKLIG